MTDCCSSNQFFSGQERPPKPLVALRSFNHIVITSFSHIPVLIVNHAHTETRKCSFICVDSGNVNTKKKQVAADFTQSASGLQKRFLPEQGGGLIDQRQANLLCPVSGSVKHQALRGFIREEMPSDPPLAAGPETGKGQWGRDWRLIHTSQNCTTGGRRAPAVGLRASGGKPAAVWKPDRVQAVVSYLISGVLEV